MQYVNYNSKWNASEMDLQSNPKDMRTKPKKNQGQINLRQVYNYTERLSGTLV